MDGPGNHAALRIEFVSVDLNGDGDQTDEKEGFFRVYQSSDHKWLSAKPRPRRVCSEVPAGLECETVVDLVGSRNCGVFHGGVFTPAPEHDSRLHGHNGSVALESTLARCFLGGAEEIWNGFVADDGLGRWLRWAGSVDPELRAARPSDAEYLWPLHERGSSRFNGVIFVEGTVIISGELRGRVTLVASDDVILGDDLTYVTDPSAGRCEDMAGFVAGGNFIISNNALNAAWQLAPGEPYRTYDESTGEFLHGVVLALGTFTAEDLGSGSATAQECEGYPAGRGCLYLTGGIIQNTRGAVGLTDGRGYVKRYSYDKCAATQPPPYFPTTAGFVKGRYFPVDPAGFDLDSYFSLIAHGNQPEAGN
jgi:hypothetical protein